MTKFLLKVKRYEKHDYYSFKINGSVYMIDLTLNRALLSEKFSITTFTKRGKRQIHKPSTKVSFFDT